MNFSLSPFTPGELGLARRVRPSRPVSACSFSALRLNLLLTHGIPPDIYTVIPVYIFFTYTYLIELGMLVPLLSLVEGNIFSRHYLLTCNSPSLTFCDLFAVYPGASARLLVTLGLHGQHRHILRHGFGRGD